MSFALNVYRALRMPGNGIDNLSTLEDIYVVTTQVPDRERRTPALGGVTPDKPQSADAIRQANFQT